MKSVVPEKLETVKFMKKLEQFYIYTYICSLKNLIRKDVTEWMILDDVIYGKIARNKLDI